MGLMCMHVLVCDILLVWIEIKSMDESVPPNKPQSSADVSWECMAGLYSDMYVNYGTCYRSALLSLEQHGKGCACVRACVYLIWKNFKHTFFDLVIMGYCV